MALLVGIYSDSGRQCISITNTNDERAINVGSWAHARELAARLLEVATEVERHERARHVHGTPGHSGCERCAKGEGS